MKEQDQVASLAELDGWNHWFNGWNRLEDNTPPLTPSQDLPNYLTSYDAIIPLIQKQNKFLHFYDIALRNIKTPAQLCEALLRATGKWIE